MTCSSLWKSRTIIGKSKQWIAPTNSVEQEPGETPFQPIDFTGFDWSSSFDILDIQLPLSTGPMVLPDVITPNQRTTTTTTIFTPGNNKMDQAMAVKSIADEFLGAAGFVAGAAMALTYAPAGIGSSAQRGEQIARGLGNWMYYSLL
jgi:hypothetical protein